jgi:GNAT superfamily N-acetyltransferase
MYSQETAMIHIGWAESPQDIAAVRGVIRAFNQWVVAEVAGPGNPSIFAGLEAELASLPGRYGPPTGCLVLARLQGEPVGCVAYRSLAPTTMEIKRMFVLPQARGHRLGERMLAMLLDHARAAGHRRALLSTHPSMHAAHAIYHRAGFVNVPQSTDFPGVVAGIDICMEMPLDPPPTTTGARS